MVGGPSSSKPSSPHAGEASSYYSSNIRTLNPKLGPSLADSHEGILKHKEKAIKAEFRNAGEGLLKMNATFGRESRSTAIRDDSSAKSDICEAAISSEKTNEADQFTKEVLLTEKDANLEIVSKGGCKKFQIADNNASLCKAAKKRGNLGVKENTGKTSASEVDKENAPVKPGTKNEEIFHSSKDDSSPLYPFTNINKGSVKKSIFSSKQIHLKHSSFDITRYLLAERKQPAKKYF
eukprot:TRINITY_DN2415_c0_g4_i1.p1 TRINITY_DN2415_c0_g4~~TRINITY_DN2415_c0_g4_i1.p1  ORF type:complete len:236 (+),score=26.45 TRINITY_DN2415_c0_g4_i1:246-953(+)